MRTPDTGVAVTSEPLIPRSLLFADPQWSQPTLSPSGEFLAFLAPLDGVLNLWVVRTDGGAGVPVTTDRNRGVRSYHWTHDDQHLMYLQDRHGDENWHLYVADTTGAEAMDVTPLPGVQAFLLKASARHPRHLLVGLNPRHPALHDIYRLDITTGELELVEQHPGLESGITGFLADHDLRIRAATRHHADGSVEVLVRESVEQEWRCLVAFDATDSLTSYPVGFCSDGRELLLLSSVGAATTRLVAVELASGSQRVLAEDPAHDVIMVLQHPLTEQPQVAYLQRDRQAEIVLDSSLQADLQGARTLCDGDMSIVSRDRADQKWVIGFLSDTVPAMEAGGFRFPGTYYLLDRKTGKSARLFDGPASLGGYRVAAMRSFMFQARDGLPLSGYLTFPAGLQDRPLPTVLLVHGGPWLRDTWGWTPDVQLLANRGYLVAQVNFRGSVGFGKAFVNAGDRQWAGAMHEDLVDTVHWLIRRNYTDPDRVAIVGTSYGGYAALVGATFTPELFRCAVSCCGPSNLVTLLSALPPYWLGLGTQFRLRVGDPEADREDLLARSPLSYVDRVTIPVLVAQGANDPRVPRSESDQFVAALRERGVPVDYLVFDDEGHGLVAPRNKLRFWAAVERFLAEHLGGRFES